jgi:hypothetical protein
MTVFWRGAADAFSTEEKTSRYQEYLRHREYMKIATLILRSPKDDRHEMIYERFWSRGKKKS